MSQNQGTPPSRRGLNEIKTRSVGGAAAQLPHKTHMRLVTLEMERYRREQERGMLLQRAAKCEARISQIEAEARILLAIVGREHTPAEATTAPTRPATSIGVPPRAPGLTHTY